MNLTPKTQRDRMLLIVAGAAIVALIAYWQLVYAPRGATLTQMQTHINSLESSNQRAKAEMAKGSVNDLRSQVTRYEQNLVLMRQLVPTSNEVPALLDQVSTAARRVNLDINGVTPEPVVEGDQFDTYRYQLTVIGSYHSLAAFLANVGSLTRVVAPVNLTLTPASSEQMKAYRPRSGESALAARFEIQTYVIKTNTDEGPMPPHSMKDGGAKT